MRKNCRNCCYNRKPSPAVNCREGALLGALTGRCPHWKSDRKVDPSDIIWLIVSILGLVANIVAWFTEHHISSLFWIAFSIAFVIACIYYVVKRR